MNGTRPAPSKESAYTAGEIEEMSSEQLLEAYRKTGETELKWALVLRYQNLIKQIALQIRGVYSGFAQVEDIINEGVLTILSSVDKYDPEKGAKFETFVTKRIRGMIIDLARKQDWTPRSVRKRAREIDDTVSELSHELGRYPLEQEVSDRMGVSLERYQKDLSDTALCSVMSLETLLEEHQMGRGLSTESDPSMRPEEAFQQEELQVTLARAISALRPNEQTVLSLYYQKELNMKKIAAVMEISEPRVSQIHARAIQKLRLALESYLKES